MTVSRFGLPPRAQSHDDQTEIDAAAADRVDLAIAVFALGVILGWLIGGVA